MSYQLNVLSSYAYLSRSRGDYIADLLAVSDKCNVLIDSGGFTEYWNSIKSAALGKVIKKIQVEDYIEFCHKIKNHVYGYIQLDKPRNPVESTRLLDAQVSAGLHPMPIFIQGMEWERLPELLEINERVCISAGWQSNNEYSCQRYQKAYKLTDGKIKSHALAWGRYPQILGLPIASADSSTWINGSRYGVVMVFDKVKGLVIFNKTKLSEQFNKRGGRIIGKLLSYKVTIDDMNDGKFWRSGSYYPSLTQSTHTFAFLQVMKYIKQTSNIDYFIVLPGLSKNTHFSQLSSVLGSITEEGSFDFQVYKSEIRKIATMNSEQFIDYTRKSIERFSFL